MERTMTYDELITVFNIYKTTLDNMEKDFLDNVQDKLLDRYVEHFNKFLEKPIVGKLADMFFGCAPKYQDMVHKPLERIRKGKPDWNGCIIEVTYYEIINQKWYLNEIEKKLKLWHYGSITLNDNELGTFKWISDKTVTENH